MPEAGASSVEAKAFALNIDQGKYARSSA